MKQKLFRWTVYLLGLFLLAVGLTLNTKTGLGTSCIISVPFTISQIWGLNFGNTTFAVYVVFVLVQLVLIFLTADRFSKKEQHIRILQALLQLPFSKLFTWMMNLVSDSVPVLAEAYPNSFIGSLAGRVIVLLLAVTLIGVGTSLSLNMRLVPNTGDGIVRGLAEFVRIRVGLMKNIFDCSCCCVSLILGLILTSRVVGIGAGTLVAALAVGRVIALCNRLFGAKLCRLAGVEQDATAK